MGKKYTLYSVAFYLDL